MKHLLLPALGLVLFTSSCRTAIPLDPMTMKASCRCLPEHFKAGNPCACGHVGVTSEVIYTK